MSRSTSTSTILLFVAYLLVCASTRVGALDDGSEQIANWQAYLEDHPDTSKYRLIFEWDHIHEATIFVDGEDGGRVYNAEDDVRCNGDSSVVARDGKPYWMPRFFPRPVSSEITAVTGVKFASADWQPCGHKEITICHAESHYDFHMYYEDEETMNKLPRCQIGVPSNPDLPVCRDSAFNGINHDYFRLINHSIPLTMSMSRSATNAAATTTLLDGVKKNFCVDASSAVLRSGVHYGDASETLDEWKTPVTIVGSHNCQLKFFEPMFSWKWVSGCVPSAQTSWPVFEVANIKYTKKGIESLPDSWKIEVSEDCKAQSCFPGQMDPPLSKVCHIKLITEGTKCPTKGCTLLKQCGNIKDCSTGMPYVSPWKGDVPGSGGLKFCFSGSSSVTMEDGSSTRMRDLRIGDRVQVSADGKFDTIYSFGHYEQDATGEYLRIQTRKGSLEISAQHMLFLDNNLNYAVPAASVRVGDVLLGGGAVIKIDEVMSKGAFAPFTGSGTIVVDNVVASNYVSLTGRKTFLGVSMHLVAHMAVSPRRFMCQAGLCSDKQLYTEEGVASWIPFNAAMYVAAHEGAIACFLVAAVLARVYTRRLQKAVP